MRRTGGYRDHLRPKIVQIGPVVQALEQFSHMQSEREQTLVVTFPLPRFLLQTMHTHCRGLPSHRVKAVQESVIRLVGEVWE